MPALLGISQRSFNAPWSNASFEAEFLKPYSTIYLYEQGGTAVGYLIIWVIENEGEIASLAVDKGFREKGVAGTLMRNAFSEFENVKIWQLEVSQTNQAAISLYTNFGFKKMRVIQNYYGQGKDAIQMRLEMRRSYV